MKKFLLVMILLMASAQSFDFANAADVVYILGPSNEVAQHYIFDNFQNAITDPQLAQLVNKFNRHLEVRIRRSPSLVGISDMILSDLQPGDRLRGLFFTGHGNEETYSFSPAESYGGRGVAELLVPLLNATEQIHSQLVIYFSGCMMAGLSENINFQDEFVSRMARHPTIARGIIKLTTIAHVFTTGEPKYLKASFLDRLFLRSGVGSAFEKVNFSLAKYLGAYSQKVVQLATFLAAFPALFIGGPEYGPVAWTFFIELMLINQLSSISTTRFGKSTGDNSREGFVYDFLSESLKSQCAFIFK